MAERISTKRFIEEFPIDNLTPWDKNPRKHVDYDIDKIIASIQRHGFIDPIETNSDHVICAGHGRLYAARKMDVAFLPVIIDTTLDDPAKFISYNLASNRTAENSEWDIPMLTDRLIELRDDYGIEDYEAMGFPEDEYNSIIEGLQESTKGFTDPDAVPEPSPDPITKTGDLWLLGNHRLLCGDVTKHTDVDDLMHGEKTNMVFTDPPWNAAIGTDKNPYHRQREGLINDDMEPIQYQKFLNQWISNVKQVNVGDMYCVLGPAQWPKLDLAFRLAGYHWSATIIWVKDTFVLGRSNYHRRYEPIWYGWDSKKKSSYIGDRDKDDVWEIPRPRVSPDHPTMKPVDLMIRAINNSSRPRDIVFDPFGGSGSTLIACESTRRICYMMEIDPQYCDVIVKRWEEFTGQKAKREKRAA